MASIASPTVLPGLSAAISSASLTIFIASFVLPPAICNALVPALITSPVSNGVTLAFSLKSFKYCALIASSSLSDFPAFPTPIKCLILICCCSSSIPPLIAAPAPAVAIVSGIAIPFASAPSLLLIPFIIDVALSFAITIGLATVLPKDFIVD